MKKYRSPTIYAEHAYRVTADDPHLTHRRAVVAGLCCLVGIVLFVSVFLRRGHVAYDELERGPEATQAPRPPQGELGRPVPLPPQGEVEHSSDPAGTLDNYCSFWPPPSATNRPLERTPPPPGTSPDCDALPLDFSRPPFEPLQDCPNVFLFVVYGAGNGHRLSTFAAALSAAFSSRAAVVIDRAIGITSNGDPGLVTEAFAGLFGIRHFRRLDEATAAAWASNGTTTWGQLELDDSNGDVDRIRVLAGQGCGRLYKLGGCSDGYCMESSRMGHVYQNARPILRRLYASGTHRNYALTGYSQAHRACPRALAVAWHFRNGDVTLYNNDAMFKAILASITAALGGIPALHYIFMPILDPGRGFAFLWGPDAPPLIFMNTSMSAEATFVHLAAADALIQLGSSFSYMASMAAPPSQVRLYAPPKEVIAGHPGAYDVYWLDGSVPISTSGVDPGHEARLAALLRARYEEARSDGDGCSVDEKKP